MECPKCKHAEHLEVDMHCDGYSEVVLECGDCGVVFYPGGKIIFAPKLDLSLPTTSITHTTEEHTKFSNTEDELTAEDESVWFS